MYQSHQELPSPLMMTTFNVWEYETRKNASASMLPPEIKEKLHNQTESLYRVCPYWKTIENIAYP
jgi:hypothetical protein